MVMPRNMNVQLKKDGQTVYETTCTRGCMMEPNEFQSVVKEALGRFEKSGNDKNDWTSVAVGQREVTKEEFEKMGSNRPNFRRRPGKFFGL